MPMVSATGAESTNLPRAPRARGIRKLSAPGASIVDMSGSTVVVLLVVAALCAAVGALLGASTARTKAAARLGELSAQVEGGRAALAEAARREEAALAEAGRRSDAERAEF